MSSTIRTCRPSERRVEVLEDAHDARGLRRGAVGRDGHEVDLAADVEVAHQVGQEQEGALQDPDQQQVLALVVAGDVLRHRPDAVLQVVRLDEDLADLFAHGAAESRRQASRTRARVSRSDAKPLAGRHARAPTRSRRRRPPRAACGAPSRGTLRSVNRSCSDFAAAQPERAHPVPRPARRGPRAWRRARPRRAFRRRSRTRPRSHTSSPSPNATRPGIGERLWHRLARSRAAGSILTRPYSEMARRPPGRSSVAVPGRRASATIASACAAMLGRRARRPLVARAAAATSRASAGDDSRGRRPLQRPRRRAAPRRRTASSTVGLVAQLRQRAQDVRLGAPGAVGAAPAGSSSRISPRADAALDESSRHGSPCARQ